MLVQRWLIPIDHRDISVAGDEAGRMIHENASFACSVELIFVPNMVCKS